MPQVHHVLKRDLKSGCFCGVCEDSLMFQTIDEWVSWDQQLHDRLLSVRPRVVTAGETASISERWIWA